MGNGQGLGIRGFQGKAGRRNHFIFIDFSEMPGEVTKIRQVKI